MVPSGGDTGPVRDYPNGDWWSVSLSLPMIRPSLSTSRYRHYIVDCHLIEVQCIRAILTILMHRHFSEKRSKGSIPGWVHFFFFSVLPSSQFNKWHAQNELLSSTLICLLSYREQPLVHSPLKPANHCHRNACSSIFMMMTMLI
jgi:hypothetical protein